MHVLSQLRRNGLLQRDLFRDLPLWLELNTSSCRADLCE